MLSCGGRRPADYGFLNPAASASAARALTKILPRFSMTLTSPLGDASEPMNQAAIFIVQEREKWQDS